VVAVRRFVLRSAAAERDVAPIVGQCLDGVCKWAESIDEKEDSRLVVERYKSGFSPPSDLPFEDLSQHGENASVNGSTCSIQTSLPGSAEKKTILGTITGGRVKKRSGLLGLFANSKVCMGLLCMSCVVVGWM